MDTPYQWTKQVASHWGGTRNGTIVHWPSGITGKGEIRSQFHHVIDVAPTVLEAARLPAPVMVNGVQQKPLEGVSMLYSFNDAAAADRHETQYFEMFGNRGIYHKGWTAVTKHRTPWETGVDAVVPAFDDDVWELYDTNTDWSQARDLAKEHPGRLAELQRLWLIEAVKYNVVPLDDRFVERGLPETAGRPTLIKGKRQLLFGGMGRLTENSVVMMKNTSFSITADVTVKGGEPPEGVLLAQGGVTGGHTLYAKDGKPKYCYNFFGLERYYAESTQPIPEGNHQVRMEFTYDGGGVGQGGTATLYIDGVSVGEGRIEQTEAFLFSADETCDVGDEFGSPVTTDTGKSADDVDERTDAVDLDTDLIPRGEREVVARHDAGTGHQVRPRRKLVLAIEPVGEFEEITLDPGQFGGPGEHRRTVSFDGEADRRSRRRQDVDHQSWTERRAVGVDLRLGQVERVGPLDRAARHVVTDRVAEDPARPVHRQGQLGLRDVPRRVRTDPHGAAVPHHPMGGGLEEQLGALGVVDEVVERVSSGRQRLGDAGVPAAQVRDTCRPHLLTADRCLDRCVARRVAQRAFGEPRRGQLGRFVGAEHVVDRPQPRSPAALAVALEDQAVSGGDEVDAHHSARPRANATLRSKCTDAAPSWPLKGYTSIAFSPG